MEPSSTIPLLLTADHTSVPAEAAFINMSRISKSISNEIYSLKIEVNSASASNAWYAFKSCANSGVQTAFNFLVLATIADDFICTLISGIEIDGSFRLLGSGLPSSKSPLYLSVGCMLYTTVASPAAEYPPTNEDEGTINVIVAPPSYLVNCDNCSPGTELL